VTHLVVKEEGIIPSERLVPVAWVAETGPDRIRINRTRDELARAEPFVEKQKVMPLPSPYCLLYHPLYHK